MKKTILIILISISMYGSTIKLDKLQGYILNISYNIGKTIKCSDGLTFENTLAAIALTESSAGKELIGDKYEDKYYYINKNKNIIFIKSYKKYIKINDYRYKVYKLKGQLKPLYKSSLGVFQIKLLTAKLVINTLYPEYKFLINNNNKLIQMLLSNVKFSAKIAGGYLKLNYEKALKNKMWNPYFRTVSKYNGGWNNKRYYKRVIKNMKLFKKYIRNNNDIII